MNAFIGMTRPLRLLLVLVCLGAPSAAWAASDVTLFRLFLLDGSVFVTYGEFVRLPDNVIFSMPVGGAVDQPRLQVATLRASLVDWPRTERYAASARYQKYAETRGEEDFQRLSNDVAAALNTIALSTDRQQALVLAERVRQMVAAWPQSHYGYRHSDVRDIVSVLDQAISTLRAATGANPFELSLVAMAGPPEIEPVLGMPGVRQQLDQLFRLAALTSQPSDRVALLQAAVVLVSEAGRSLPPAELAAYRRKAESAIKDETSYDRRYANLSEKMLNRASRAAQRADSRAIEKLLQKLPQEDAKLGSSRPQLLEALNSSLQNRLDDARDLRLRRDQWALRRAAYSQYQRRVNSAIKLLSRSTTALEAIRTLDGPAPDKLVTLRVQLSGGALRLERIRTPEYLRDLHQRLIGTWRFAENAVNARYTAVSQADAASAWEASSAAAGALMMLTRVQQDLEELLDQPRLEIATNRSARR
jgi:hypothetical protein